MLQKTDVILLLTDLQEQGIDVKDQLNKTIVSPTVQLDVLKFINDHRSLDVTEFYKHIRKSYNNKRSDLYVNIMKEVEDPQELLTTLASFSLQSILYSKNVSNKQMFLRHARLEDVEKCLLDYAQTYSLINCQNLISLLRADIKAVEALYR